MTAPIHFYDYTHEELTGLLTEWGAPRHTGDQVYQWLYKKKAKSFEDMTDLPKTLREELSNKAGLSGLKLHTKQVSQDGTAQYLWQLPTSHSLVERRPLDEKGPTTTVEIDFISMALE